MSDWNGLMADGSPISMTMDAMAKWAYDNEQPFSILWGCAKEFTEADRVPKELVGARLVTVGGSERTFAEAATRAGWPDMAERFREAGL